MSSEQQTLALEAAAENLGRLADAVEDHNLIIMYGIMQKHNHGNEPTDAVLMIESLKEAKQEETG